MARIRTGSRYALLGYARASTVDQTGERPPRLTDSDIQAAEAMPPHFHIVGPDFQVLVRISDLHIIDGETRAPANSPTQWHGRALIEKVSP